MVWSAGLALALRVLFDLGSGSLGVPLTSIDALARWVDESAPGTMALALLRLAALAGTSYLAACTVLLLVAVAGRPGLAIGIARLSPAVVRRLVSGSTSIGLAAGTLLAAVSPALAAAPVAAVAAPAPDDIPTTATSTTRRVDPPPRREPTGRSDATDAATATMTRLQPAAGATATLTRLPPAATVATKPEPYDPPTAPAVAATSPKPAVVGTGPGELDPANDATWAVAPGDSFWSIATETLATPGYPPPGDRAVDRYWRRLIAANQDRLLDVDNPDLLVPGQELVLPDPA